MCRKSRALKALMLITMLLLSLGLSSIARADSSEADLIAQLYKKIDAQQSEVRLLQERLAKAVRVMTSGVPPERLLPLKPAQAIEITDIETWWDSDGRYPFGLAPSFRFRLRNAGSKPITNLDLSCTYYLASGTKFGSGSNSVVPNVVQILAPGHWMKVEFDWREYSRENGGESPSLRPMTVQAEVVLSTDQDTRNIVRRITIPPKPRRLPVEAASR
jgi:hypothetical protein